MKLLEELKLAGCLLEEEVDDLGGRDGCHEGGVRCRGRADRLRDGAPRCLGFPFVKTLDSEDQAVLCPRSTAGRGVAKGRGRYFNYLHEMKASRVSLVAQW